MNKKVNLSLTVTLSKEVRNFFVSNEMHEILTVGAAQFIRAHYYTIYVGKVMRVKAKL